LQVLAAQLGDHFAQTLHFDQQRFFSRPEFLPSARLSRQRRQRRPVGQALPLVKQRGTDLILIAHLADRQIRRATIFENLKLGCGGKLPPVSTGMNRSISGRFCLNSIWAKHHYD